MEKHEKLFNYMMVKHGIVLIESELYELRNICFEIDNICNCASLHAHSAHCKLTVIDVSVLSSRLNYE